MAGPVAWGATFISPVAETSMIVKSSGWEALESLRSAFELIHIHFMAHGTEFGHVGEYHRLDIGHVRVLSPAGSTATSV